MKPTRLFRSFLLSCLPIYQDKDSGMATWVNLTVLPFPTRPFLLPHLWESPLLQWGCRQGRKKHLRVSSSLILHVGPLFLESWVFLMPWVPPSLNDYFFSEATLVGWPPCRSFTVVENQPFHFSENDLFWACALGVKYTLPALWLAAFSKPLRKPSRREGDRIPSHTRPRDSGAVSARTAYRAHRPRAASPWGLAMGNSAARDRSSVMQWPGGAFRPQDGSCCADWVL